MHLWDSETVRPFLPNEAFFVDKDMSRSDCSKKAKQTKERGAQICTKGCTPLSFRVLQLFFSSISLELFQDVVTHTELVPLSVTDGTT